jgi:hypothetical protein
MTKRAVDLTAEELDRIAGDAWFEASRAALRAGAPVVGREGTQIVKTHPDGRREILAAAPPLLQVDPNAQDDKKAPASKPARRAG